MTEHPPVPRPRAVRAKLAPRSIDLTYSEIRFIRFGMPDGLTKEKRKELLAAAKRAVLEYRQLHDVHRLGIPRNQRERGAAIEEIVAFRESLEAGESLPALSDELLGWAVQFAGPGAVDVLESARLERTGAIDVLETTQKGIEGIARAPRRHADHAAFSAGVQFANEWREITGRGTSYRYRRSDFVTTDHGPFVFLLRAVIGVASGDLGFDGAALARAVHKAVTIRRKNDEQTG